MSHLKNGTYKDIEQGSKQWAVKQDSYKSDCRTRLSHSNQRFSSNCVKTVPKQFIHRVTGVAKQTGVIFSGKLPIGYIPPNTYLPKDAQAGDYLRAVSEITKSNKPNYQECRIAIPSNFNIKLWQKKLSAYHDQHKVNL